MKMETNGHHHNVSNGNLPEDHAKDDDLEDEEILAEDNEWNQFDEIIGCIEDIVIEKQFQDLQESFLEKHYHHFEIGTEENKLIYMELFQVSLKIQFFGNFYFYLFFRSTLKCLKNLLRANLSKGSKTFV